MTINCRVQRGSRLIVLLFLSTSKVLSANPNPSADDIRRLQLTAPQAVTIIDVRPPNDYAKGHIQGSRNIPIQKLSNAQLPPDSHIIVYCGDDTCPIGEQAKKSLSLVGTRDVQTLVVGHYHRRMRMPTQQ